MGDAASPLLDGADASAALDAIAAVATAIAATSEVRWAVLDTVEDPDERATLQLSLSNGWAGAALLFDALEARDPGRGHGAHATRLLERAIMGSAEHPLELSLHRGIVGIAFASDAIARRDGDDPSAEVDAAVREQLAAPWAGDFDVVDGLAGVGAYLLARWHDRRPGAADALAAVVDGLDAAAIADGAGLRWPARHGLRELGLAHGTAGIVALLAQVHRAGIARERAARLIAGGAAWLRAHEHPDAPVRFAGAIARSGRVLAARHGWCSGDLSVAVALLAAARAEGDAAGEDHAIAIALQAAAQDPARVTSGDASLCHGAAGAGHLLHRLYRATGDARLADAARRWFARVLALRQHGIGVGGFLVHEGEGADACWLAHPGLLVGAAGTALALLAATGAWTEPRWDHALLLGAA